MSLTYSWEYLGREVAEVASIVRQVTWRCTATDADGNTASIDGSVPFDVAAVLTGEVDGLTGTRPAFVEEPTDAQCLQWVIDMHNAEQSRLLGLEVMLKKELYGDADDNITPQPTRDPINGQQLLEH